jgi:hypothetical protein
MGALGKEKTTTRLAAAEKLAAALSSQASPQAM